MVQDDTTVTTDQSQGTARGQARPRTQTKIEFPYADLPAAVELVTAIHSRAGSSAEDQEVAAWLDESVEGGTFRSRRSSARMFGLIDVGQGRLTLTSLGRQIVDESEGRAARVEAFLKPELFAAMYEQFRGNVLPPVAAIERHMEQELGVPPKQKTRARQVFQKSAHYAGFIDETSGRFVKPGIAGDSNRRPSKEETRERSGGGGGGDGDEPPRHPLIEGLFKSLPKDGDPWTVEDAADWLETAAGALRLVYKFKGRITVEIEPPREIPTRSPKPTSDAG